MRYIVFLAAIWLVFVSCSSTPPAEGQDVSPQQESSPGVQEAATEPEGGSADTAAAGGADGDFPTEEFLPLANEPPVASAEDGQEYLEEIEIVDLAAPADEGTGTGYGQDDLARILEPEVALVVEAPAESADVEAESSQDVGTEEDMALVVEEVVGGDVADDALAGEDAAIDEAGVPDVAEEAILVDSVDEAVPEIVVEELVEDMEPVEASATQEALVPVEPSRSVAMDNRQYLDIRYPGAGWVYLGEVTREGHSIGTPSLTYFGRRRTSEDTSFTLRSTRPGTTILHFYKQDVLSATFIDDFLEVTISEDEAELGSRIVAPGYGVVVPGYQDAIPQPQALAQSGESSSEAPAPTGQADQSSSLDAADTSQPQSAISVESGTVGLSEPDVLGSDDGAAGGNAVPSLGIAAESNGQVSEAGKAMNSLEPDVSTEEADTTDSGIASAPQPSGQSLEPVAPDAAAPPPTGSAGQQPAVTSGGEEAEELQIVSDDGYERDESARSAELALVDSLPDVEDVQVREPPAQSGSVGGPDLSADEPGVSQELGQQSAEMAGGAESPDVASLLPQEILSDQDALLAQAQEYFYAEDFPASLEALDKFFAVATGGFDAAYYLKGQVLESNSSIRNIREAQRAYKHVIDSYPQSPFWERAKKRHTYLSRLYFDIR